MGDQLSRRGFGRAAVLMRRALRDVGRIDMPGAKTTLRMSQGIHSGNFHFFMAGATHHELVVAGPAWSRVVSMEHVAEALGVPKGTVGSRLSRAVDALRAALQAESRSGITTHTPVRAEIAP